MEVHNSTKCTTYVGLPPVIVDETRKSVPRVLVNHVFIYLLVAEQQQKPTSNPIQELHLLVRPGGLLQHGLLLQRGFNLTATLTGL